MHITHLNHRPNVHPDPDTIFEKKTGSESKLREKKTMSGSLMFRPELMFNPDPDTTKFNKPDA